MSKRDPVEKVISTLRSLEEKWPDNLWIWCADGMLHVMMKGEDGEHVMTESGGVDQSMEVCSFAIDADGGDW